MSGMTVALCLPWGDIAPVTVHSDAVVADLQDLASRAAGMERVHLVFGGEELGDEDMVLANTGLVAEGVVMVRPGLSEATVSRCKAMVDCGGLEGDLPRVAQLRTRGATGDRRVVLHAVARDAREYQGADEALRLDPTFAIEAIAVNPGVVRHLGPLSGDKKVILAAIQCYDNVLEYAAPALQADRDVVLAAVCSSGTGRDLQHASRALRNDREVVMAAVKRRGMALEYASPSLRGNRSVVLAAVSQKGDALQFADVTLLSDEEVVLRAVMQSGTALRYAASPMRGNKKVVSAAVKTSNHALKYASPRVVAALGLGPSLRG
eukprot:Sspe_Gene.84715::Locus_55611_Transcript_2_2_Confidence_0.667_Length_1243::g.84715::m.84715